MTILFDGCYEMVVMNERSQNAMPPHMREGGSNFQRSKSVSLSRPLPNFMHDL